MVIDNIDLRTFNGQKHFDYKLSPSDIPHEIFITNRAAQEWANLWGIEYWTGKCVRFINDSFSAESPNDLDVNWDYVFENDKPDLIVFDNYNRNATSTDSVYFHAQYDILNKIKAAQIDVFCVIDQPIIDDYTVQLDPVTPESFTYSSLQVICDSLKIPYFNMHKKFIDLGRGTGYTINSSFQNYFKDRAHLSFLGQMEFIKTLRYVFRPNDVTGINRTVSGSPLNNYILYQNYPNPFNPITNIKFNIPKRSIVTLEIYNMIGEKIKTLVNGELNSGTYEKVFDGKFLSSGIYIYRLTAGLYQESKKLIILK